MNQTTQLYINVCLLNTLTTAINLLNKIMQIMVLNIMKITL